MSGLTIQGRSADAARMAQRISIDQPGAGNRLSAGWEVNLTPFLGLPIPGCFKAVAKDQRCIAQPIVIVAAADQAQ